MDALTLVESGRHALLDVRSQGEFAQGALPGFRNAPILNDDERHQVGIVYKQRGQDAAIALGHRLVDLLRAQRVNAWSEHANAAMEQAAVVTCWRGGLRSKISCEWLSEAGVATLRVDGGYKAMRQILLDALEESPSVLLLAGLTGSGKTRLLANLPVREKLDLEGLACHRGSSFGAIASRPQPSQATFENSVAMSLRGCQRPVLVEDESVVIGSLHVPLPLRQAMQAGPVIYVEAPFDVRVSHIFEEYVSLPLHEGLSREELRTTLHGSILKLSRRLGGALTSELVAELERGFAAEVIEEEAHRGWIVPLLQNYYDKGYKFSFEKRRREVVFRGTYEECRQWILERYA